MTTSAMDLSAPRSRAFSAEVMSSIWSDEDRLDPLQLAMEAFAKWTQGLAVNEELFRTYVYENRNLRDSDLRQHRCRIYGMLALGEDLALKFLRIQDPAAQAHVNFIDDRLKQLRSALETWHGPFDDSELPESFKEASREVAIGDLEDFEDDLISENASSSAAAI